MHRESGHGDLLRRLRDAFRFDLARRVPAAACRPLDGLRRDVCASVAFDPDGRWRGRLSRLSQVEADFYERRAGGRAGTPTSTVPSPKFFVTAAPMPTRQPRPIVR